MQETKYTAELTAETSDPAVIGRLIHEELEELRTRAADEVRFRFRRQGHFHGEIVTAVSHPAVNEGPYAIEVTLRDFGLPALPVPPAAASGALSFACAAADEALTALIAIAAEAASKSGKKKVEFPVTTFGCDVAVTVDFK